MASGKDVPRIVHLADTISSSVARIREVLSAKGIPPPSFDEDASFNVPAEVANEHDAVLDATAELHDLLLEPLSLIHRHAGHNNAVCLQAIAEFKIADLVPLNGQIKFCDIASQTPMTEDMTARLLRHAMIMRVFREPEPGMVAHTTASRTLSHSAANDWLRSGTREMWPAATKMVDALKKWPKSQELNQTVSPHNSSNDTASTHASYQGFALSNGGSTTIYDIFAKDAERASQWVRGMEIFTQRPQFSLSYVTEHYDWKGLGRAQVVDMGGSQGHVSLALARRFDNLSMVVQNIEGNAGNATAPEELRERVTFMTHDLFAPQPVQGAEVYFSRWILHTWSDKYCILILRALIPALKNGARIIIQDTLMPKPGTMALWKEKNLRFVRADMKFRVGMR
ncbi:putative sterigmatocystin 8-O-methyltransferase [Rosellinia necatrix]|uniref:Putative sterigmatocystin 8-O-methyltransferase n=1 Tax=Rosellinia necatrix TaxID=77044 RepID=A0A1W2TSI5_ROSNE|nr:putative sterigmatocystin 8-O-methyltransferase [Rosellinia necatrix]